MNIVWSAVLVGLLVLVTCGNGQGLAVTITTTPPSPPFQAATWIRFACQSTGISVTYNWTVYCAYNQPPDQPRLIARFTDKTNLGEISLSLRSTARFCADTVVCSTRDIMTGNTGQATWSLGTVTGIGFWGSAVPIENNSALVADSSGQIGTLYCHSSSNITNAGQWYSPDGSEITENHLDSFEIEFFSGEGYPSYSTIEITGQDQFTSNYQGAYSCTAPDNNGVDQTAVIWIYPNGYQGTLEFSLVGRTTVSPLTLNCDTTGLPATLVQWSKGSSTLSDGPVYQMQQSHGTNFLANFTNELVINQPFSDAEGIYSCIVVNGLHEPMQNMPEVSIVQHSIGLYTAGSDSSVTCNFDDDSAILIRWETPSGSVITENPILALTANDSIHNTQFVCHGYNTSGSLVEELLFKVIVNVPDSTLVAISISTVQAALGMEFSVTCHAAITANSDAFLSSPMASFNYENGTTISSQNSSTVIQGPVTVRSSARVVELVFDLLKTSHAGRYICRASLDSPALDEALVKESVFQLNFELPSPVSITLSPSHPSPYFAGSTVTLTCEAMASSLIDSSINALFSWTKNGEIITGDSRMSIAQATSTATAYQSILTITQLNHELDNGSYQCSAFFEPVSSSVHLSSSNAEASSSLNINVQVQSLLVSVNPTEVTVLDVSPHNVITISCLATDQDNTTVGTKLFTWSKQDTNTLMITSLQHNGGSVSIVNRDTGETTSISMLTTSETQASTYVYTCMSTQLSLNNTTLLASGSASVSVTFKGPSNPVQPFGLSAIVLGFSSTRIEWTVPSISYTRETHSVVYGFNQQHLNDSSTAVTGTSDLNAVNQVYSTNLTNLEEGRTYYYRVQSMNTVGGMLSDIVTFQVENSPIITSLYESDPSRSPIAGQFFTLNCESVERESIEGLPTITWLDALGDPVSSGGPLGPIYITSYQQNGMTLVSSLEFRPLKASFSQEYTCEINFSSIGVVKTHNYDLQVIVQTIPVRVVTLNIAFLAAHQLQLSCEIDLEQSGPGIVQPIGDVTYSWTSTCTGACFVNGRNNQSISTLALRAVDSGVHTCSAVDSVGNIGNGSIEIEVTGVGMYSALVGVLSNNSFILATNGGLDTIYCISGSTQPEVGRWIAPNGEDFTEPGSHPFNVVHGGTNNPGVLDISLTPQGRFSSSEWLGVYSCVIPDEENVNMIIHIGIHAFNPPAISILSLEASSSSLYPAFTVNCTSTGSVATTVNWFKSGQLLSPGILYEMVQILRDGVTSTYDNLLLVHTPTINELTGEYHCELSNNVTRSPAMRDTMFRGLKFSECGTIELSSTIVITCSSDLGVTSIEWLYNGQVIESAEGAEAVLVIESVSDVLHEREYTCRARARFGNEERTFRILLETDPDDLSINITPSQSQPQANQPFSLTCTIVKATGLSGTPTVEWYDAMGNLLSPNLSNGVSIETDIGNGPTYTSTLSFAKLKVSHSGEFTCTSQIMTPAIPGMINTTAEWDLIVTGPPTPALNITIPPEMCTKVFQLLLSDVNDCQSYRFTDQESKISSIIDSIVGSVNEIGFDVCTSCQLLTVDELVQPTFDCDSRFISSVLFRAKIMGSGTCEEIVTAITNWVSSGRAAITVNFNTLRANQDCVVEIDSVETQFPPCTHVTDPIIHPQGDIGLSVGAAISAIVVVLLLLTIAIITAMVCLRHKKKTRRVTIQGEHNSFQNTDFTFGTGTNEAYGARFTGENPYYYATGPGQTNSMIPLAGPGHYSSIPAKRPPLPIPTGDVDNYIKMASASVEKDASTSYYNTIAEKAEKDEQLYAEIPHNYQQSGVYQTPRDMIRSEEHNIHPENQYEDQKTHLRVSS